jgi:hypothetical protein
LGSVEHRITLGEVAFIEPHRGGTMKALFGIFAVVLVVTGSQLVGSAIAADPELIGSPKCKICHKAKTGNQWGIWEESAHAKAYEVLASDESKQIAAEKGLGDPQKADECLVCHATRAFLGGEVKVAAKGKYADSEGVGCEACHGPGSEYKSKKTMSDPEAARAAGLQVHEGEEHCKQCHNENSPTYKEFVYEERWAEIAHPVPEEG